MAEKLFDTEERQERIILVGVETAEGDDTKQSLEELEELGQTAGAVTVGMVIQKRERMHPGTYIGKGKIEEVAALVSQCNADTVVCDDELSPAQLRNLSDALDVKVIDRTVMILDIFAKHATTNEGKLQVELAQLRYRSSHLIGERTELSRLGGGIGTRGPGEQKLEQDRRLIRNRISQLKKELEQVTRTRTLTRKKRQENPIPVIAIVGYTNAGKSTLLNYLTGAGVLSQDKLFATLDPTTRKLTTQEGEEFLFTDTVGFIRKLPHHLIQAFRSTLEEAKYADMILHVVDCANPDMDAQMFTVYETLRRLKVGDKKVITAFNKIDLRDDAGVLKDLNADETVRISAKTGEGLEELLHTVSKVAREGKLVVEKTFSYAEGSVVSQIRSIGKILEEDYRNEGIYIKAEIPREYEYLFVEKKKQEECALGNYGALLVTLPQDKKQFQELTMGGVILGGRKTMEGLPGGTTLKGRKNVILTNRSDYRYSDGVIVHSVEEALEELRRFPEEQIYIIGGEQIYRQFLPYCDKAYITKIDYAYEADTHFPNLDEDPEWEMTHISDEQTYYDLEYHFTIYQRK